MADQMECIGWQFRYVFATHKSGWSSVLDLPRKMNTGDSPFTNKNASFEVRDVFAPLLHHPADKPPHGEQAQKGGG